MSSQRQKPKSESYVYSWFLPADGHNTSAVAIQMPSPELEADPEETRNSQVAAMEARTEEWRHSGSTRHQSASRTLTFSSMRLRLAGIGGWSAIAGVGAAALFSRAGPLPRFQLDVLGWVWLGVSVAIWFVPGILSRLGAKGQ